MPTTTATDTLNKRQRRFVEEYLVDLNAAAAARRAGIPAAGAGVWACRALAEPKIQEAVAAALAARSTRTQVEADRVVSELASLALYDPADLCAIEVTGPQDIPNLPETTRRAIIGWGWDRQGNFILKLSPKTPALDLLGRHLGMWNDKLRVEADLTVRVRQMSDEDLNAQLAALLGTASDGEGAP